MAELLEHLQSRFARLSASDSLYALRSKAWQQFYLPKGGAYRYVRLRELYGAQPSGQVQAEVKNAQAMDFTAALQSYGTFLRGRLAQQLKGEKDPFALLNLALHDSALFIYVPPQAQATVQLQLAGEAPRVHLVAGRQAQVQLTVTGEALNALVDIAIEESASVTAQHSHKESNFWMLAAIRATLKREARFTFTNFTCGSLRTDLAVQLLGENSEADLAGAWHLCGRQQAHTQVRIEHIAPNCCSRQLFKGVLSDTARSSFTGMIDVEATAQKTDAFQLNKNLLLSPQASANAKPELEIRADDVKASHGATVGQLEKEELFYLSSRGIPHVKAKELIVRGFLESVCERML